MPETFSMTAVLVIFYSVFLAQILFLSVYIPGRIVKRVNYVYDQFPPASYPLLYPIGGAKFNVENAKRGLKLFRGLNLFIALIGIMVLQLMITSGYRPDVMGGDEIMVLIYFALQITPSLHMEMKEYKNYKLMREHYSNSKRSADLTPRRLFDFVSPFKVLLAVVAAIVWLYVYLTSRDFGNQPSWEIYVTLLTSVGMQFVFAGVIARHLYGKKQNPYASPADQLRTIGAVTKTLVMACIGMSVFLTITVLVDEYRLEIFDPVLSSIYFQFCAATGIVFSFNAIKLEKMDFEVYRGD